MCIRDRPTPRGGQHGKPALSSGDYALDVSAVSSLDLACSIVLPQGVRIDWLWWVADFLSDHWRCCWSLYRRWRRYRRFSLFFGSGHSRHRYRDRIRRLLDLSLIHISEPTRPY
eukprot:TRINITY_DN8845_c0_g1_i1.p1 TRINITY_DN8845_c0_g1~~TRINITY_DN8845_c0_g1_i1.p1  ORF type:complete len:114 (-),score=14.88 TRINITY_DN8845_c0_g1_i1:113-454(-)